MQKRKVYPSPLIDRELRSDEELLWQGKPKPIRFLHYVEWSLVLFGIFFCVMTIAILSNAPLFGPSGPDAQGILILGAILVIFLGAGAWYAVKPILLYIEGMGTTYALTNRRAIVATETFWKKQIVSYDDRDIKHLKTKSYGDDTGSVFFTTKEVVRKIRSRRGRSRNYVRVFDDGFIGIDDARDVEDLMSQVFFGDDKAEKSKRKSTPITTGKSTQPTPAQLEDRFGQGTTQNKYAPTQSRKNPPVAKNVEIKLTQSELDELRELKRKKVVWKEPSQRLIEYGYVKKIHSRGDYLFEITEKGIATIE